MQANMHVEACTFDANSYHDQAKTVFLRFARRGPSEMKSPKSILGWFWVSRAECAGALRGDLRGVRDLQI